MVELTTNRLLVREVLASDADQFLVYRQEEHYWRHIPIEPPTRESIVEAVDRWIQYQARSPRIAYNMAVVQKGSGQLVGDAGLFIRDIASRQCEIGWGVISSQTRQGFGTEVGLALLRLAFKTLGMHRAFAQCRVENHASRSLMAKLRMQQEGVLRENVLSRGSWWSSVQCSILSDEFDP